MLNCIKHKIFYVNLSFFLLEKEINNDSCSTIRSIATYTEGSYQTFKKLVEKFEVKHGCDKNIPQRVSIYQCCLNKNQLHCYTFTRMTSQIESGDPNDIRFRQLASDKMISKIISHIYQFLKLDQLCGVIIM